MKIFIETKHTAGGWLQVMTYNGAGRPMEPVFIGTRQESIRERTTRFDRWCNSGADEVTTNAVPVSWS